MVEQNREVEQAVSALTTEILKLTPLDGDAAGALNITIKNALSRLAPTEAGFPFLAAAPMRGVIKSIST